MAYIDNDFLKKNEEEKNNILNQVLDNNTSSNNNPKPDNISNVTTSFELDVNKKNREEYEKLMDESKSKLDSYYDKDNIFIKILLVVLFIIIVLGCIYYLGLYLNK